MRHKNIAIIILAFILFPCISSAFSEMRLWRQSCKTNVVMDDFWTEENAEECVDSCAEEDGITVYGIWYNEQQRCYPSGIWDCKQHLMVEDPPDEEQACKESCFEYTDEYSWGKKHWPGYWWNEQCFDEDSPCIEDTCEFCNNPDNEGEECNAEAMICCLDTLKVNDPDFYRFKATRPDGCDGMFQYKVDRNFCIAANEKVCCQEMRLSYLRYSIVAKPNCAGKNSYGHDRTIVDREMCQHLHEYNDTIWNRPDEVEWEKCGICVKKEDTPYEGECIPNSMPFASDSKCLPADTRAWERIIDEDGTLGRYDYGPSSYFYDEKYKQFFLRQGKNSKLIPILKEEEKYTDDRYYQHYDQGLGFIEGCPTDIHKPPEDNPREETSQSELKYEFTVLEEKIVTSDEQLIPRDVNKVYDGDDSGFLLDFDYSIEEELPVLLKGKVSISDTGKLNDYICADEDQIDIKKHLIDRDLLLCPDTAVMYGDVTTEVDVDGIAGMVGSKALFRLFEGKPNVIVDFQFRTMPKFYSDDIEDSVLRINAVVQGNAYKFGDSELTALDRARTRTYEEIKDILGVFQNWDGYMERIEAKGFGGKDIVVFDSLPLSNEGFLEIVFDRAEERYPYEREQSIVTYEEGGLSWKEMPKGVWSHPIWRQDLGAWITDKIVLDIYRDGVIEAQEIIFLEQPFFAGFLKKIRSKDNGEIIKRGIRKEILWKSSIHHEYITNIDPVHDAVKKASEETGRSAFLIRLFMDAGNIVDTLIEALDEKNQQEIKGETDIAEYGYRKQEGSELDDMGARNDLCIKQDGGEEYLHRCVRSSAILDLGPVGPDDDPYIVPDLEDPMALWSVTVDHDSKVIHKEKVKYDVIVGVKSQKVDKERTPINQKAMEFGPCYSFPEWQGRDTVSSISSVYLVRESTGFELEGLAYNLDYQSEPLKNISKEFDLLKISAEYGIYLPEVYVLNLTDIDTICDIDILSAENFSIPAAQNTTYITDDANMKVMVESYSFSIDTEAAIELINISNCSIDFDLELNFTIGNLSENLVFTDINLSALTHINNIARDMSVTELWQRGFLDLRDTARNISALISSEANEREMAVTVSRYSGSVFREDPAEIILEISSNEDIYVLLIEEDIPSEWSGPDLDNITVSDAVRIAVRNTPSQKTNYTIIASGTNQTINGRFAAIAIGGDYYLGSVSDVDPPVLLDPKGTYYMKTALDSMSNWMRLGDTFLEKKDVISGFFDWIES